LTPAPQPAGATADGGAPPRPPLEPRRVAAIIAIAGLVLTAAAAFATARIDANSERRLLHQQTKQAAGVLAAAIMLIEQPLHTALSVEEVAAPRGEVEAFTRFMDPHVGTGQTFVTASLWQRHGNRVTRLAGSGSAPALPPDDPATQAYVLRGFDAATTTVRQVTVGSRTRIAWVRADPRTGFAVYAERAIPANRRAPVDRDSAYAKLDYAIYVGRHTTHDALSTTDVDPASLPLRGLTDRASVPFGDTVLTLITSPREHLGSAQSQWLPLGLLIAGLLLTVTASLAGRRLVRGRRDAEQDAATITTLYEQVGTLYGQQRDLFERLQRALLPHAHPEIADLEIASRYVAGALGTEIGGDWYSVVALDDHRFGFVVGDVSGRGVDTVAVMAQARFTIRAYLLDGNDPAAALEKCSHQFDIATDGHLTTVITGIGDVRTGEVTIANAGHPLPLLVNGSIQPVDVPPGRPLGTGPARYDQTTIQMPPGSTLFCFTDGLVERRGESIDVGLDRLVSTLADAASRSVDELVSHAVQVLRTPEAADDIAALALRRAGAR
jgi:serine phosphatase RsbU (regulator of sigma subunit)